MTDTYPIGLQVAKHSKQEPHKNMTSQSLDFQYEQATTVTDLSNRIRDCVETLSLEFDGYDEDHLRGPGLYYAIVSNQSVGEFAEPMGSNTWPVDTCRRASADIDAFYNATEQVAHSCDGGVCIGVDGRILEQMVRFKNISNDEIAEGLSLDSLNYADWMGARHMSAYETSLRPDVITTITLSEESGRITVFQDGEYETIEREMIGGPWRGQEDD